MFFNIRWWWWWGGAERVVLVIGHVVSKAFITSIGNEIKFCRRPIWGSKEIFLLVYLNCSFVARGMGKCPLELKVCATLLCYIPLELQLMIYCNSGSEMESCEKSIWNNTPFLPMIAFLIFSPNDCFRIFYIYLGSNL